MMKSKHYTLSEAHEAVECDLMTWANWLQNNRAAKIVKQETTSNGKWVSTVFLGLDHNFSPDGPPILFETMIFPENGDYDECWMDRYSTWDQAVVGHANAVRIAEENKENEPVG